MRNSGMAAYHMCVTDSGAVSGRVMICLWPRKKRAACRCRGTARPSRRAAASPNSSADARREHRQYRLAGIAAWHVESCCYVAIIGEKMYV